MLRSTSVSILIFALSGCAHTTPLIRDSACQAFVIIHPSRQDTADTKRQVLVHNTTWRRLCVSTK